MKQKPRTSILLDLGSLNIFTHYKRRRARFGGRGLKIYITIRDKKTKERYKSAANLLEAQIFGPIESGNKAPELNLFAQPLPSGRYLIRFNPTRIGKYKCVVKFQGEEIQPKSATLICFKKHRFEYWKSDSDSEPSSSEEEDPDEPDMDLNFKEVKLTS